MGNIKTIITFALAVILPLLIITIALREDKTENQVLLNLQMEFPVNTNQEPITVPWKFCNRILTTPTKLQLPVCRAIPNAVKR